MEATDAVSFGSALREARLAAGLTQEALAERAGVSVRNIQSLERGQNRPQQDTAQRLATALRMEGPIRVRFLAAATPAPRRRSATLAADMIRAPAAAPESSPTNLPLTVTSFVGREREIAALTDLLTRTRLLTLTGTGGVGKTRLALQLAGAVREHYPQGIWLVELAPLAQPELVVHAVAQALRLQEDAQGATAEWLVTTLRERYVLLLLDNCEHLLDACAQLSETLVQRCPHLCLLATSREALGLAGEVTWRVPSLALPPAEAPLTPERLAQVEAARLFLERAQAVQPPFALTSQNAVSVAQVCRRLDGIPLALELAAARLRGLSVAELAGRLDQCFGLLTAGRRTALPRQQTLRATVAWSYNLLSAAEQALFARLSVLASGFPLEAAEAVCAGGAIAAADVLDLLLRLVDKSLLLAEEDGAGGTRYRPLETLRQYGAERLAAAGETEAVKEQHLWWCLTLAEEAEPQLTGPEQAARLARLEEEHDNLRVALAWALERGAREEGLRLAGALWRFWDRRGHYTEGRRWLEAALAGGERTSPSARAKGLHGAGVLADRRGDYGRAERLLTETLDLRAERGDHADHAGVVGDLGWVAYRRGDWARARALFEQSLALGRQIGDKRGIANALFGLALEAVQHADYDRAAALYGEGLALMRALGDTCGIANALNGLGLVTLLQGDYDHSVRANEESLALKRALGDKEGIIDSLKNLGWVAQFQRDLGRAAALQAESLRLSHEIGAMRPLPEGLESLAWVAAARERPRQAALLSGAAEALREAVGMPQPPGLKAVHDPWVGTMRAALGEATFAAAWAEGRVLSLDDAVALALAGHAEVE